MSDIKQAVLLQLQIGGQHVVQRGLDDTSKSTTRFGRSTELAGAKARKSFAGISRSAIKMGVGVVGAYASIAGAKNALNATEALAKSTLTLNKSFGLSVHTASQWAAVSQVRGADGKALTMGFKALATQTSAARKGSKGQLDAFKQLGVGQADLVKHGNNLQWVIRAVSDGLAKMPRGTASAALSAKLFGRTWTTIAPLIRGGTKEMDANLAMADKYGATFSNKGVGSVEDFIKAQREAKLATLGLQVAFGTQVAPVLTTVIQKGARFVAQMRSGTGAGGKFAKAAKGVWQELKPLRDILKGVATYLIAHPKLIFAIVTAFAGFKILTTVTSGIKAFRAAFAVLNLVMSANPIGLIIVAIAALAAGLIYAYHHSETFRKIVDGAWGVLKTGFGWVKAHWPLLLSILTGPFGAAGIFIARHFGQIIDFLKDRLNNVIDVINLAIKAFNFLPGKDIRLIAHIAGVQAGARGAGTGLVESGSRRARGGPVVPGVDYWVGEEGPERVRFGASGYVHDARTSAAMSGGGGMGALVAALDRQTAAIHRLANRPQITEIGGREVARSNADRLHFEEAFA